MAKKIYLSPSIQKRNIFCVGGITEAQNSNAVTDILEKALKEKYGFEVKRNSPSMETISQIIADSNAFDPDIHVAIHSNAGGGRGCEVMCGYTENSKKLAQYIYNEFVGITPSSDRGVKDGMGLGEIKSTNAYATLIEMAFHDNTEDATWLINNRQACSTAIEKGICKYFGVNYIADKVEAPVVTPTPISTDLYRVRKSWADVKSQKGAFASLENAKKVADSNPGYYVFNSKGEAIYPVQNTVSTPPPTPAPTPTPTIAVGTNVKVAGATWATGQSIPSWVKNNTYTVIQISGEKALLGGIMSWAWIKDLVLTTTATAPVATIKVGSTVKVIGTKWATGQGIPSWVHGRTYKVIQINGEKILLGSIMSWIYKKDVKLV